MSTPLYPVWFDSVFFDTDGTTPLTGGKIYSYYESDLTPAPSYNQNDVENPFPVIIGPGGRAQYKLDPAITYQILIWSADGRLVNTLTKVKLPGSTGAVGATGAAGAQGPRGTIGADGPQGEIGPAGPQGEVGPEGPQGEVGPEGPQGPLGMKGDQGPQGEVGPAGPQAEASVVEAFSARSPNFSAITSGPTSSYLYPWPVGADILASAQFELATGRFTAATAGRYYFSTTTEFIPINTAINPSFQGEVSILQFNSSDVLVSSELIAKTRDTSSLVPLYSEITPVSLSGCLEMEIGDYVMLFTSQANCYVNACVFTGHGLSGEKGAQGEQGLPGEVFNASYTRTFTEGDLTSREITFTHGLASNTCLTTVYDPDGYVVIPTYARTVSSAQTRVSFSGMPPLVGTWTAIVLAAGGESVGPQGEQGPQGPQGDTGVPGPIGATSMVPGPTGPRGYTGPMGPNGIGATGVAGPAGPVVVPGGNAYEIQYNAAGSFGGASNLLYDQGINSLSIIDPSQPVVSSRIEANSGDARLTANFDPAGFTGGSSAVLHSKVNDAYVEVTRIGGLDVGGITYKSSLHPPTEFALTKLGTDWGANHTDFIFDSYMQPAELHVATQEWVEAQPVASQDTGIADWSAPYLTATTTTFGVAALTGAIYTGGYRFPVAYAGATGMTTPYISTHPVTYVMIDSSNTIQKLNTYPTPQQRRENIFLGRLVHKAGVIQNAVTQPDLTANPLGQVRDMWAPIKYINEGVQVSPNDADLTVKCSTGYLHGMGANYAAGQNLNPTRLLINAQAPATFQYRTQTDVTVGDTTVVDPSHYDLAGTITAMPGGGGTATNQRWYIAPSGRMRVQYGQTIYSSLANAIAGIATEAFVVDPTLGLNLQLIGTMSLRKDTTNLSLTNSAVFTMASKFGELGTGTAGISTTTLQNAYDNSATPEFLTDATRGAVSFKAGVSDTNAVFEAVNMAGNVTMKVDGDGDLYIGTPTFTPAGEIVVVADTHTSYLQTVIQNKSAAFGASSDFVVCNDISTDGTTYGDFGINSSGFTGVGSAFLPNATYLTATGGELVVGTTTANGVRFLVNGQASDALSISALGKVQFRGSTGTSAGLNIAPFGAAPTSPVDGDVYKTAADVLKVQMSTNARTVAFLESAQSFNSLLQTVTAVNQAATTTYTWNHNTASSLSMTMGTGASMNITLSNVKVGSRSILNFIGSATGPKPITLTLGSCVFYLQGNSFATPFTTFPPVAISKNYTYALDWVTATACYISLISSTDLTLLDNSSNAQTKGGQLNINLGATGPAFDVQLAGVSKFKVDTGITGIVASLPMATSSKFLGAGTLRRDDTYASLNSVISLGTEGAITAGPGGLLLKQNTYIDAAGNQRAITGNSFVNLVALSTQTLAGTGFDFSTTPANTTADATLSPVARLSIRGDAITASVDATVREAYIGRGYNGNSTYAQCSHSNFKASTTGYGFMQSDVGKCFMRSAPGQVVELQAGNLSISDTAITASVPFICGGVKTGPDVVTPANYGIIYGDGVTPSASNYAVSIRRTGEDNSLNATSVVSLSISNVPKLSMQASAVTAYTKVVTAASTTSLASLNIPHGAAPTSPANGDVWTTTAGMFVRINGVTKTFTLT